jgi:hypothetical protein
MMTLSGLKRNKGVTKPLHRVDFLLLLRLVRAWVRAFSHNPLLIVVNVERNEECGATTNCRVNGWQTALRKPLRAVYGRFK